MDSPGKAQGDRKEGYLCRNETRKALEELMQRGSLKWRVSDNPFSSEDILTTECGFFRPLSAWLYIQWDSINTKDDLP